MTPAELNAALSKILSMEEVDAVDWEMVQDMSIVLLSELRSAEAEGLDYPSELVIPFLTDFHLRQQSVEESIRQRSMLVAYLRSA
jgi:hypothetical protein